MPLEQRARARRAPAYAAQRRAQGGEVAGRVDVELQRRRVRHPHRHAGGRAERRVAGERARRRTMADRVGRRDQQRVRPAAVSVGHDHDAGAGSRRAAPRAPRVERGAVAGHEQHALGAARDRRADAARRRGRLACLVGIVDDDRAGRARRGRRALLRRDDDQLVEPVADARSAASTSPTIAAASSRGRAADRGAEPLLGLAEALDGQHRRGPHARANLSREPREREVERLSRHAAARRRLGHRHVGLERRQRAVGSSATRPVEQPAYSAAMPVGAERQARPRRNTSVGPLSTCPRTSGETATTAAGRRAALPHAGSARIGPIEMTGLDGPITIAPARRDRREHLGRRRGRLGAA